LSSQVAQKTCANSRCLTENNLQENQEIFFIDKQDCLGPHPVFRSKNWCTLLGGMRKKFVKKAGGGVRVFGTQRKKKNLEEFTQTVN
jgi:hypothetical protein